jgi:Mg-chelatase subunit ChlD
MDITSQFLNTSSSDANTSRTGGILLKGRSRSTRQPVHMMMLVDTSGSMDDANKLESVKRSLQVMLVLLSDQDRLSLVTFDDTSKVHLNRTTPTATDREAISYRISGLHTNGSTNMSSGLLEIRERVEDDTSGRKQGILMLTDGLANMGVMDTPGLVNIVRRILQEKPGVSISTVGYGADHNTDLLTEIAKEGGGAYNVVKSLEDVASTFGDVLGGLMSISVQRATLEFPPGYKVYTSYPTTVEPSGFTLVNIGDIYSDTEITVLYEGNPSMGPIRVLGTDMMTLDAIDTLSAPELITSDDAFLTCFVVAQFRREVSEMLKNMRSRRATVTAQEIQALMQRIRENTRIQDHPIVPFLLEDLQQAHDILAGNRMMSQEEATELAQHSAYIGMSRGLRTQTSNVSYVPPPRRGIRRQRAVGVNLTVAAPSLAPDDEESQAAAPPLTPPPVAAGAAALPDSDDEDAAPRLFTSPTANAVQRQMLSVMRTMSMQP